MSSRRGPGRGGTGRGAAGRAKAGQTPAADDLRQLQAEILEGLDSGPESGAEEWPAPPRQNPVPLATPLSKRAAASDEAAELTEAAVLAASGESRVEDVTQLVYRDMGLASLTAGRSVDFLKLLNLEILSLSRNELVDISPLAYLVGLVEVNVNFNRILDLSPLFDCESLEKLFASHNHLDSVAGLEEGCTRLVSLSLLSNRLDDASELLETLQALPKLRSLDLAQNPCMVGPSQRYNLLKAMPDLELLDGHKLGSLDRRLASNFLSQQGSAAALSSSLPLPSFNEEPPLQSPLPSPLARPGSAPAAVMAPRPPLLPGQKLKSSRANRIDDMLSAPGGGDDFGVTDLDLNSLQQLEPHSACEALESYSKALSVRLDTQEMERDNLRFGVQLAQRDRQEAAPENLQNEVRKLADENANSASVVSERDDLRSKLEGLERDLAALDNPAQEDSDEDENLEWEHKLLLKRWNRLQDYERELKAECLSARALSSHRKRTPLATSSSATTSSATDDCSDDLAELLQANEVLLSKLHSDVHRVATAQRAATAQRDAETRPPKPHRRSSREVNVLTLDDNGEDVESRRACVDRSA